MPTVGIRALKQNASEMVARAASGERITITDRGRPVARISGLEASAVERLVGAGRARPALTGIVALASSDLARTELLRALRRGAPGAAGAARDVLSRLLLITASAEIFDQATRLDPVELRSLDAVHLASALALGDDLEGVVTYDDRLGDAARDLGVPVICPR